MLLYELTNTIKSTTIYGLAGYGAGILFDAKPTQAAALAAIYNFAASIGIMGIRAKWRSGEHFDLFHVSNSFMLGTDLVAIAAARSLNLIGNKGLALLGTFTAARFAIGYFSR